MSYWAYLTGTVVVEPLGRTQEEKEYILKTALNHLPIVSGSEENMYVDVAVKKSGARSSSSHDEFLQRVYGGMECYEEYILTLHGSFRDRVFDETYRQFIRWLCRLAKRVLVDEVLVRISSDTGQAVIDIPPYDENNYLQKLYEWPSWAGRGKNYRILEKTKTFRPAADMPAPNWCEYLLWESAQKAHYPLQLMYKYYDDPDTDKEMNRRYQKLHNL